MIYGNTMASVYDALNDGIDVGAWADFIIAAFERYSDVPVKRICEIACGTGGMATELAKRGYDVTASDLSTEMLTEAEHKSRASGVQVRYVSADMRSFSLYSAADACLCLLDSINYLTKPSELKQTFLSVHKNLVSGGLFIFDVNSKHKFESVYSDNAYVIENDGVLCAWQNFYGKSTKICDFYLSIFTETESGLYERTDEHQRERMYTERSIRRALGECGFEVCGVFSDYVFSKANEDIDDRLYIVAKKV